MRETLTHPRAPLFRLLSLLAVLALAGCAGRAGAEAGPAPEGHAMVRVQNNAIPPTTLTVWAVPETGVRTRLGVVRPSATETFHFEPIGAGTRYRLLAETTAGTDLASQEFSLSGTAGVVWDISANIVRPIG